MNPVKIISQYGRTLTTVAGLLWTLIQNWTQVLGPLTKLHHHPAASYTRNACFYILAPVFFLSFTEAYVYTWIENNDWPAKDVFAITLGLLQDAAGTLIGVIQAQLDKSKICGLPKFGFTVLGLVLAYSVMFPHAAHDTTQLLHGCFSEYTLAVVLIAFFAYWIWTRLFKSCRPARNRNLDVEAQEEECIELQPFPFEPNYKRAADHDKIFFVEEWIAMDVAPFEAEIIGPKKTFLQRVWFCDRPLATMLQNILTSGILTYAWGTISLIINPIALKNNYTKLLTSFVGTAFNLVGTQALESLLACFGFNVKQPRRFCSKWLLWVLGWRLVGGIVGSAFGNNVNYFVYITSGFRTVNATIWNESYNEWLALR